jgi:hypothetical protein
MEEFDKLFTEINNLKEKHKKEDLFNGFMSFGIGADETKHSKFIGMLLNPKGAHNQKDKFLKLFLQQVVEINEFEIKNSWVEYEKTTFQNRRIDIAIENDKQIVIIENKFWASDQPRQLIDYFNYGKEIKNGEHNVFMVYLHPYGRQPGNESLADLDIKNVKCVSYEKHITKWIEECIDSLDETVNMWLKISLEMYVGLIRRVINRDKYMTEIMNNLISSPSNMELAIDIVKAFQGKNFLSSADTRESILSQIRNSIDKHGWVFEPYEEQLYLSFTIEINGNPIGDLCFDGAHIYGEKLNQEKAYKNQIVCNDINDVNLYYMLTKNSDEVDKWLENIVAELMNM